MAKKILLKFLWVMKFQEQFIKKIWIFTRISRYKCRRFLQRLWQWSVKKNPKEGWFWVRLSPPDSRQNCRLNRWNERADHGDGPLSTSSNRRHKSQFHSGRKPYGGYPFLQSLPRFYRGLHGLFQTLKSSPIPVVKLLKVWWK